eukprot:1803852-Pyramimonas_sp.AAC.1
MKRDGARREMVEQIMSSSHLPPPGNRHCRETPVLRAVFSERNHINMNDRMLSARVALRSALGRPELA